MTTDDSNLVPNPSFDVDASGWDGDSLVSVERSTAAAHEGEASLLATFEGESDEAGPWTGIPAIAGHTYTVSMWVRDVSTGVQHRAGISFFDGLAEEDAQVLGEHHWGTATTISDSDWTQISITETAPEGTARMYVGASTASLAASGSQAYFDQVSVIDVS